MSFLAPWALIWLGSVPVLLWLWRLASTKRQIRIPSLVPFEHLVRRQARRRTRLVVNWLFWLQLALLIGLALALAQPILLRPRATTILAILDTSASMGARAGGRSTFERAKQQLQRQIEQKAATDQVFLVATSPPAPVLPQPTTDTNMLTRAIRALPVSHLDGNLATTVRIGRALLGGEPDTLIVVTDEPPPADRLPDNVQWVRVGEPQPNVAIVGFDAQGSLCAPAEARIVTTVQNFSDEPALIELAASQRGRGLSSTRAELAPHARVSVPLPIPSETEGELEIILEGPRDSLDVDNRAWFQMRRAATLPVVVHTQDVSFAQAMSRWLSACPAVSWTTTPPSDGGPYLLVTNQEEALSLSPAPSHPLPVMAAGHSGPAGTPPSADWQGVGPSAIMVFRSPRAPTPILAHWVVSPDHPIGAYLAPLEVVAARLDLSATAVSGSGIPVVSALVHGRKLPIIVAEERDGRRLVWCFLDPSGSQESTPMVLAFFNSLRWLMGSSHPPTVGEPLTLGGFEPGTITVRRPNGSTEHVEAQRGMLQYDGTTLAGRYQFSQRSTDVTVGVTFIDPLESNLLDRVSTWRAMSEPLVTLDTPRRVTQPLASMLMWLLLIMVLAEWWLYAFKVVAQTR